MDLKQSVKHANRTRNSLYLLSAVFLPEKGVLISEKDYYLLNLAPRAHPEFCFLEAHPPDDDNHVRRLSMGQRVGEAYPSDFSFYMDERNPGFHLPSLIGNTLLLLIVRRDIKEAIALVNTGEIEFKPILLINHKKKLASQDYFIVNPIGHLAVLDEKRSDVTNRGQNRYRLRGKPVLSREKLREAPDLFRLREDVFTIIVSSALVDALRPLRPTNFLMSKLEITEPLSSDKTGDQKNR